MTRLARPRHRTPSRAALWAAMLLVAALVGVVAWLGGAGAATGQSARTAAEARHLLTAVSLAGSGNLDLSGELAQRRWAAFHPQAPRSLVAVADRVVNPAGPGLPALLAAVAGEGPAAVRVTLAALASMLAALLLWTAVRRFAVPVGLGAMVVALFGVAMPLTAVGHRALPGIPAAIAVTVGIIALTGPLRRGGPVALAVAVAALCWLGAEYLGLAAVLAAAGLWGLWRAGRRVGAAWLGLALAAIVAVWVGVNLAVYGVWAPSVLAETSALRLGAGWQVAALLVDRGSGLAAWQPAWLLGVAALGAAVRARPDGWGVLVVLVAVGWAGAIAMPPVTGAQVPGARLVAILPAMLLAVAWWAHAAGRRAAVAVAAFGALGVWSAGWLVTQARAGELVWTAPFGTADPWYRLWLHVLPNYLDPTGSTWVLHVEWVLVLAVLAWAGWRSLPPWRVHFGAHMRQSAPAEGGAGDER